MASLGPIIFKIQRLVWCFLLPRYSSRVGLVDSGSGEYSSYHYGIISPFVNSKNKVSHKKLIGLMAGECDEN